jgi:hypothetical protein
MSVFFLLGRKAFSEFFAAGQLPLLVQERYASCRQSDNIVNCRAEQVIFKK